MSVKKVMYVIFFTNPAILIAAPKSKSVNAKFYKLKKYFQNQQPATSLHGVRLLHDNASSHKANIVREYQKQEKVAELPFLTLLIRQILSKYDFFPISEAKKTPPFWKKISNAKNSQFGYFPVSEQNTSKRL
jgi:hypothetical protein